MGYLKRLFRNLFLLIVIGLVFYLVNPTMAAQVYEVFGLLFGPVLVIILIIAAALPRNN
jgi:hypothetical protein